MLNIKDLQWLAGFLEGEGSFLMTKKGKGLEDRDPRIVANQKQKWPLEKVLSIMQAGSINYSVPRDIYFYTISCNKAIQWMMTLYSLMSPRRQEQIKKVILLWKGRPGTGSVNRNKTHCPKGHKYTEENTWLQIKKNGKTGRICKICRKERKGEVRT